MPLFASSQPPDGVDKLVLDLCQRWEWKKGLSVNEIYEKSYLHKLFNKYWFMGCWDACGTMNAAFFPAFSAFRFMMNFQSILRVFDLFSSRSFFFCRAHIACSLFGCNKIIHEQFGSSIAREDFIPRPRFHKNQNAKWYYLRTSFRLNILMGYEREGKHKNGNFSQ